MRHRLDRLVCQVPATPARRACVDGTAVREANERGQREETRQGARTDRHAPTPPRAQQRLALPMRAVLTVVRVVGSRRARCGRGGQRTRATLRRAPSATALAHRTHTYNSPAIRPTRHHTCTTPTHAYTHPHRHHHDLLNIQRRHVGAALRHRLDRLVCQVRAIPARRACVDGTAVRQANERGLREETRQGGGLALIDTHERRPTLSSGWCCRCGRC